MSKMCSAFAVLDIIYFLQTFQMPKEMRQQKLWMDLFAEKGQKLHQSKKKAQTYYF